MTSRERIEEILVDHWESIECRDYHGQLEFDTFIENTATALDAHLQEETKKLREALEYIELHTRRLGVMADKAVNDVAKAALEDKPTLQERSKRLMEKCERVRQKGQND